MTTKQKNILLLCAEAARHTGTVDLHIKSFKQYSEHNIVILDSFVAGQLDVDVNMFDAIIFHYSIVISLPQYIDENLAKKITAFKGPKILFIQDEFRWVDRTSKAAEQLGISVIFSVVNKDVTRKIYRDKYFDNVRFELTLTGFIPENLLKKAVPKYCDRQIDIGYRARKLPAWCGSFALQKWQIGEKMQQVAKQHNLNCDIAMSEASRIYGDAWIDFMSNCKATLGTESGASFVDYSGLVHQEIDKYEAANPKASFKEVSDKFLEGRNNDVIIHVISPRVFEAAALKVLMILYPGTYSDVLTAGRHYIELSPDFSNIDEVLAILNNEEKANEIINNAYNEIACSPKWTHKNFIRHFDDVLGEELQKFATKKSSTSDNIEQMISNKTTELEAERISEFETLENAKTDEFNRLENANIVGAKKIQTRMKFVLFLQRIRVGTYQLIDQKLPRFISVPLLSLARMITTKIKPIIKKILLKV